MLSVNVEKILEDYKAIKSKQELGIKEIENEARKLTIARGYNQEKTEKFINYVKEFGDDGLSNDETKKLFFIEEYIYENGEININENKEITEANIFPLPLK